jgi:FMN phosphatase YigB (HAD superfamily)
MVARAVGTLAKGSVIYVESIKLLHAHIPLDNAMSIGDSFNRTAKATRTIPWPSPARSRRPWGFHSVPCSLQRSAVRTTRLVEDCVTKPNDVVFLLDCDNTLLDNDLVEEDLRKHLARELGPASRDRYWAILEQLRNEFGYTDYLGALQRYRLGNMSDTRLLLVSSFLIDYPFASRLYSGALDVIRYLSTKGLTVILSDGDVVFQPRKIQRSGLWTAVEGRVLIPIHKEQMLDAIAARYPARHYVMIDDKLRILSMMKRVWPHRLTTVFPRQGHYAHDPNNLTAYPAADLTIERIGDLVTCDLPVLVGLATAGPPPHEPR